MAPDLFLAGRDPGPDHADIVIPVFNQVEYTRACLESLAAHTTYPHRLIVVDNGRKHLGDTIDVLVTSVLQTAAGRMIFAKLK